MAQKKYVIHLTIEERSQLEKLVKTGKVAAYKRLHAQILLKADVGDKAPGWTDVKIANCFNITIRTVERVRQRLVEEGFESALNRTRQKCRFHIMDGEIEAHLIAITCSDLPEGYGHWTLRLLAEKMVELKYIETISYETVCRTLKKKRIKTVAK